MPADIRADPEISPDAGIPKPGIDVVTKPVDTFVRPVSASGRALGQLAASLKTLNPALSEIEDRFKEKETAQGVAQADVAAEKDEGNWDKAVANGDIPSVFNPYARMAARSQFGIRAGDMAASSIRADPQYIQDTQNATTLQQTDEAWANARQRWEAENLGHASHSDILFQNKYQAMMSEHTKDERNRMVEQVEKNFVGTNTQHLSELLFEHMTANHDEDVDPNTTASEIEAMVNNSKLPEKLRRQAAADAIDTYAKRYGDPGVYNLADNIHIRNFDGTMAPLTADQGMKNLRESGISEIAKQQYTEKRLNNITQAANRDQIRADVLKTLIQRNADNPTGQIDVSDLEKMYANQPGMSTHVGEVKAELRALRAQSAGSPENAAHWEADIRDWSLHPGDESYVTNGRLVREFRNGNLSIAEFTKLQDMVDKRDKKYGVHGRQSAGPDDLKPFAERQSENLKTLFGAARFAKDDLQYLPDWASLQVKATNLYWSAYDAYISDPKHAGHVNLDDLKTYLENIVQTIDKEWITGRTEMITSGESHYKQLQIEATPNAGKATKDIQKAAIVPDESKP